MVFFTASGQFDIYGMQKLAHYRYKVYKSTNGGKNRVEIFTTGSNIKTYVDTGPQANTVYRYRVYALNEFGDSRYSNTVKPKTKKK